MAMTLSLEMTLYKQWLKMEMHDGGRLIQIP